MKRILRRFVGSIFESQVRRLVTGHSLTVIAVAGSVGKTSTKMAIARTLASQRHVMVQEDGNYNSEIGLPLMVFGLTVPASLFNPVAWIQRIWTAEQMVRGDYPYDTLVLELGTDHPGELAHFMTYLKPDIGVVTAVSPEHMEQFGSMTEVAKEELTWLEHCAQVVVSHDDVEFTYRRKYLTRAKTAVTYGLEPEATYRAKLGPADVVSGTEVTLLKNGHATVLGLHLRVYGEPAVKAATAAYAVGDLLGLNHAQLEDGMGRITPVKGRMRPFHGVNGSTIIDDTYNSSPEAVAAAVQALMTVDASKYPGRRIAVLGSMNELGQESPRYHQAAGRLVAEAGIDMLVTVGEEANHLLGPAALEAGLPKAAFKPSDSPYAAGEFLRLLLGAGDVVLVKGSQNRVFTEETTRLLLDNQDDAVNLVRQSDQWQHVKRAQFADAPLDIA